MFAADHSNEWEKNQTPIAMMTTPETAINADETPIKRLSSTAFFVRKPSLPGYLSVSASSSVIFIDGDVNRFSRTPSMG
jgi:hypothetical protein